MVRPRQTWIRNAERPCPHATLDEVLSTGGKVLAEKCASCQQLLAQYGKCAGCAKDKRLVHFVVSRRLAYCTRDCAMNARREAIEAAATKQAAKAGAKA